MESELLFSFSLVHEVLLDLVTVVNDSVSFVFNGFFLVLSQTLIVSDV